MQVSHVKSRCIAACVLAGLLAAPVIAADRCAGFKWDIRQELALFDTPGRSAVAGKNESAAPVVLPQHLYHLRLLPQTDVTFPVTPGRQTTAEGAYAGIAELDIAVPGDYRVAVDAALWIDVTINGRLATVTDFQGQQNCDGPHKMVEFDLSGGEHFFLQFSGAQQPLVRLTVTPVPARKL